jgi:methionyl aminopeptidase
VISLKSGHEIKIMRAAGKLTGMTLNVIKKIIRPGITTEEINDYADRFIRSHGGIPSFKGYNGFPASVCTSLNDVVVHGIPSKNTKLYEGDIISIDIGVEIDGYHGDAARTFGVGRISDRAKRLIEVTMQCFFEAVKLARAGNRMGDISSAVQNLAEKNGYGVVRALVGHGIGARLHEEPDVPNFGTAGKGVRLCDGMVLAIEPMINEGTYEVKISDDGWTVRTKDGGLSAHYENTVALIDGSNEILTLVDD